MRTRAKHGVRFDAPLGLDEKRTSDVTAGAHGDPAESRRAAALAALAGVGVGAGEGSSAVEGREGGRGGGDVVSAVSRGDEGGGTWAGFGGADAPKKRLSAK